MNCNKVRKYISSYIDGELSAGRKKAFEEHVESCPACGSLLGETRLACDAIRQMGEVKAPADLKDKILDRIKEAASEPVDQLVQPKSSGKRIFKFVGYSAAAAAAVLVLLEVTLTLLMFLVLNFGGNRSQAPSVEINYRDDKMYNGGASRQYSCSIINQTPANVSSSDKDIIDSTFMPEESQEIQKLKLIYNRNFSNINLDELINLPPLRNIDHNIQEKDDLVIVDFEKSGGSGCDIYYLYNFLVEQYDAQVVRHDLEITDEDDIRAVLVVN